MKLLNDIYNIVDNSNDNSIVKNRSIILNKNMK